MSIPLELHHKSFLWLPSLQWNLCFNILWHFIPADGRRGGGHNHGGSHRQSGGIFSFLCTRWWLGVYFSSYIPFIQYEFLFYSRVWAWPVFYPSWCFHNNLCLIVFLEKQITITGSGIERMTDLHANLQREPQIMSPGGTLIPTHDR